MLNTQTIIATERDGMNVRTIAIVYEVIREDPDFDLKEAVKAAVKDYLHTIEGKRVYEYNQECFNWADFEANVPNELCEQYGFRKVETMFSDIEVDWDEHLVDDEDFEKFWGKNE